MKRKVVQTDKKELRNLISGNGIDEFQLPIGNPEEAEKVISRTSKMFD